MDKLKIYERTMDLQAQRIAHLSLDLDLAQAQISLLNEELEKFKNSNKEKDSE